MSVSLSPGAAEAAALPTQVLVADDDGGARALMRAAMRKLGFGVTLAADGPAALQAFAQDAPAIVLLDVDMPGLDGYAVCQALRRQAGDLLPIVMVTGLDDAASVEQAYAAGATDFIAKPVNWPVLGHRVRHLLRNYATQRALRSAQQRNQAILEALPDLLFELDAQGRFVSCHAPVADDLAAHHRALMGRTVDDALSPKMRALAASAMAEAASNGRSDGRQYRLHLPDGERWFELSVARKAGDPAQPAYIALSRDITARKAAEERSAQLAESLRQANLDLRLANNELQRQTFEDPLSGLPNRALFNDRLGQALPRAAATPQGRLAVLFIDLDGFKPINDSFGHAAGDGVLREVATRLRGTVRTVDLLARLGGDEFVALIESPTAGDDAQQLCQRIIASLKLPFTVQGQRLSLSCSIGIVVHPDGEADGARLLACADAAMYEAKRSGGGCSVLYAPSMAEHGAQQLLMQQALREALERGELELFYQPKVASQSGHLHGFEALLRWRHTQFGQVSPAVFIPLAERFGLIGQIGNWVIDNACAQLARWHAQGLHCRIAINLSPHQLRQSDLVDRLRHTLRKYRLHPAQLVCEITESAVVENTEEARGTLERIAALGVRLSIDDFGIGYSSLAHLRHIPARQLKIDRSFVMDLGRSTESRHLVEAMVQLAHALQMEVVAEGVEDEQQLQLLRTLRCDLLQGYFIARPMPADAVPTWIGAQETSLRAPASQFGAVL